MHVFRSAGSGFPAPATCASFRPTKLLPRVTKVMIWTTRGTATIQQCSVRVVESLFVTADAAIC